MLGTHLRLVPGLGNGRVQLVDAEQLRGVGGGQLRVHLQQWLAQVSGGQDTSNDPALRSVQLAQLPSQQYDADIEDTNLSGKLTVACGSRVRKLVKITNRLGKKTNSVSQTLARPIAQKRNWLTLDFIRQHHFPTWHPFNGHLLVQAVVE